MPLRRTAGASSTGAVSGALGASVAKCLLQQDEPALELFVGCGERREEPDDVPVEAARKQEQSLLERGRSRRLRGVRRRLTQLDRQHGAEAAHLAYQWLPRRDLLEP